MIFWIVVAVATALAVALMIKPLMRRADTASSDADASTEAALAVYRAQLAEIDRDKERGTLSAEQAAATRAEVGRRMLALTKDRKDQDPKATVDQGLPRRWSRTVAFAVVLCVPLGVLAIYVPTGSPDLPAQPLASRDVGDREARMALLREARELEAHLEENQEDLISWLMLGGTYSDLEDFDRAADAYASAITVSSDDPRIRSLYAEAIVNADSGVVTREARQNFEQVIERDPDDPRARFYLGLAREQAGDLEGALERWVALAAETPADAPWLGMVHSRISQTAIRMSLDVVRVTPDPQPPMGQNIEAIARDPATAVRMIQILEDATQEAPDRAELWLQIGDLRGRLGDHDGAAQAFATAADRVPDGLPDPQMARILEAAAGARINAADGDIEALMTPEFLDLLTRLLEVEPENDRALWFLGAAAERDGDIETARRHWTALLDVLPPDSETAGLLRNRLDRGE